LLGNTKAVCRKCYIHPYVIDGYTEGSLLRFLNRATSRNGRKSQPVLSTQETAVLAFLQQQQNGRKKQSRPALAARRMSLHARLRQSIKAASRTRQSPRSDMRRAVKSVISG
jgi:DNA topoisomerase I